MSREQSQDLPIDRPPADDTGALDIDPERPRDDRGHDRWLRENVPPHHR